MKLKNSDNPIEKITRLIETDDSVDAPADAIKWVKNIYRTRVTQPRRSVLSQIAAVLKVDLSLSRGVAGERSAGAAAERQLLFEAGECGIDIRILKRGDEMSIRGQVLSQGYENAVVKLRGASAYETRSNEMAEFLVENITPGVYDLTIAGDPEIAIAGLDIKD